MQPNPGGVDVITKSEHLPIVKTRKLKWQFHEENIYGFH